MNPLEPFDQSKFDICCEWGPRAVELMAPLCDAVIIVDVLSFTTCVDVATARGASVFPYQWMDASAQQFAESKGAVLAQKRHAGTGFSLSPTSLQHVDLGTKIVLPSPNGAMLSLATGNVPTFAGCLRNADVVANVAASCGRRIAVIPAGERWPHDQSLRPAFEDFIGAGAIINALSGNASPLAEAAAATFRAMHDRLTERVSVSGSGRELIDRGFADDVTIATQLNVSTTAPRLIDGAYIAT